MVTTDPLTRQMLLDMGYTDGAVPTVVRFLELLPQLRCRVRGPNGLVIYILKVPEYLQYNTWCPGLFLEAYINLRPIIGELDGVVILELQLNDINEYIRQGRWPDAFLEPNYSVRDSFRNYSRALISEHINPESSTQMMCEKYGVNLGDIE